MSSLRTTLARALRPRVLVVLATVGMAASGMAACGSLTEAVNLSQYGFVNIAARSAGTGQARASATALFIETGLVSLPNSARQQSDQCLIAAVDTSTVVVRGQNNVGAVNFTSGTTTGAFTFADAFSRYDFAAASPFTYRTGDNALISVGGAGLFPSTSISVRLAEPIAPGALTLPAAGAAWTVTWNATNDTTSAVILVLKYAYPSTTTYPNEQVYCALKDDGTFDVPAAAMTAFLASPNALRSLRLTRWRSNLVTPNLNTTLHIATSVDTVVVFP